MVYAVRNTLSVTVWIPAVKLLVVAIVIKPVGDTDSSDAVSELTPAEGKSLI